MGCSVADGAGENDEGKPGGVDIEVPEFYIDSHDVPVQDYIDCIAAENNTIV